MTRTDQVCDLVIFGAKGDLSRRKLLPSLYQLEKKGHIHHNTRIIGVCRSNWNKEIFNKMVKKALITFIKEKINEKIWEILSSRLYFCNLDVNDSKNYFQLGRMLHKKNTTINYFAMPPSTFCAICKFLGEAKLNREPVRIVMEKPIGTDLVSSKMINNKVSEYFYEYQVYRIDHYLGKETVLNLLSLRFANSIFSSHWDNSTIDYVQITVAEEVGIEGRWSYFDQVGQMRDMIQNHLLQILTMISMSPPTKINSNSIRDEKVKILRSLRFIDKKNVSKNTVRGQYTEGFIHGKRVIGYSEEKGYSTISNTETFVSIRVDIDNFQWDGVPFYLRTGKRMQKKCSEVVIYLKKKYINLFYLNQNNDLLQNTITIRLQKNEGIDIKILNKIPGINHNNLQAIKFDLKFLEIFNHEYISDDYERLLLETMRGIQVLFVRRDEVEESWKWVDSIIQAWEVVNESPKPYQSGTWGPVASTYLITKYDHSWRELNQ